MTAGRITVALGEYDTGWHDSQRSLAAAGQLVTRLAGVGVDVVVLPEMATTGFTMDSGRSVTVDSPDIHGLRKIARDNRVWLIAGVAMRADNDEACAVNNALAIDPSGEIVAVHRKQRLFAYSGEHRSYTEGNESTTITVNGVRLGLFICYELRFSEVFAPVANEVDAMVLIANWPVSRQEHWDSLLRARAIENQCFMIGVNRIGTGDGIVYVGGSTAFDPWGDRLTPAPGASARIVSIDASRVTDIREKYPFLRDRR